MIVLSLSGTINHAAPAALYIEGKLTTSLNRSDAPIVDGPENALHMFSDSDLEYIVMEDILVTRASA